MTTVDAILRRRDVKTAFKLMKIDIQGIEILALQGSNHTIQSVEMVAVEASIMNYNIGGASFLNLYATYVRHVLHDASKGRLLHPNRSPVRAKDISSMVEGTHWRRPSSSS